MVRATMPFCFDSVSIVKFFWWQAGTHCTNPNIRLLSKEAISLPTTPFKSKTNFRVLFDMKEQVSGRNTDDLFYVKRRWDVWLHGKKQVSIRSSVATSEGAPRFRLFLIFKHEESINNVVLISRRRCDHTICYSNIRWIIVLRLVIMVAFTVSSFIYWKEKELGNCKVTWYDSTDAAANNGTDYTRWHKY